MLLLLLLLLLWFEFVSAVVGAVAVAVAVEPVDVVAVVGALVDDDDDDDVFACLLFGQNRAAWPSARHFVQTIGFAALRIAPIALPNITDDAFEPACDVDVVACACALACVACADGDALGDGAASTTTCGVDGALAADAADGGDAGDAGADPFGVVRVVARFALRRHCSAVWP